MTLTKSYLKDFTYQINSVAIEVHKNLGPGLLEKVYHQCLIQELNNRNINFENELIVPITYKDLELNSKIRCDPLVEKAIVIEAPKGIIYNFNVANLFA